jgi:hypothetical protein
MGEWHDVGHNDCAVAFLRADGERRFLIAANLTSQLSSLPPGALELSGELVVSTTASGTTRRFSAQEGLDRDQAVVVLLD